MMFIVNAGNSGHSTVCHNAFILPERLRFCVDRCRKSVLSYSSSPHVSFQSVHIKASAVPLVPPRLLCCHLCSILHTVTRSESRHTVKRERCSLVCFTLLLSDHGEFMWSVRVHVCADEKVWCWDRSRSVGVRISLCMFLFCVSVCIL